MAARYRILHILGTASFAGKAVNQIVEQLATSLDPNKYVLEACFLRCGEFTDRFKTLGIRSTCVDWSGSPKSPLGAAKYAMLLRSAKYDLIHQHTGGRFLTKMNRILTRAKILRHVHGRASEASGDVSSVLNLPERDLTVANSKIVADACGDPNAVVIYPGIDVNEFRSDRSARCYLIVGTASRLEAVKGIATLIDAIAILAAKHPSIRLEIAGDGSSRSALQHLAERLGVSENVSFLGWRTDINSVLQSWGIFIQPSLDEGFGVSVLEAMASGRPVIASDVGGLRELVLDGTTGFLVPSDNPTALANRIHLLLKDPVLMARMGEAGRRRAQESFSLAEMVRRTAGLYDRLLEPVISLHPISSL